MNEVFPLKTPVTYDLRRPREFYTRPIRTVHYGTESIGFLASKIWEIVPDNIKESSTIIKFKRKIKGWIPTNCPCRLCRTFIPNLGFV